MAAYASAPRALTPSSMICFRAGDLLPALERRASASETGTVCRRDLRRYYWLLAVALESAPTIAPDVLQAIRQRCRGALAEPSSAGDLTAALFTCLDLLPDWNALQLFALADRIETLTRTVGDRFGPPELGVRVSGCGGGDDPPGNPHQAQPATRSATKRNPPGKKVRP